MRAVKLTMLTVLMAIVSLWVQAQDQESVVLRGNYTNRDYGFTIRIPNGFEGRTIRPPAPQHGFEITLGPPIAGFISVGSYYDSALLESLDAIVQAQVEGLRRQPGFVSAKTTYTRLDGLQAAHIFVESAPPDPLGYGHVIIAVREMPDSPSIVYRLELAGKSQDPNSEILFKALVDSFRIRRIR